MFRVAPSPVDSKGALLLGWYCDMDSTFVRTECFFEELVLDSSSLLCKPLASPGSRRMSTYLQVRTLALPLVHMRSRS